MKKDGQFEPCDFDPTSLAIEANRTDLAEVLNEKTEPKKPIFAWVATAVAVLALVFAGFALNKCGPAGTSVSKEDVVSALKADYDFQEKLKGKDGETPPYHKVAETLLANQNFTNMVKGPKGDDGKDVDTTVVTNLQKEVAELKEKLNEKIVEEAPKALPVLHEQEDVTPGALRVFFEEYNPQKHEESNPYKTKGLKNFKTKTEPVFKVSDKLSYPKTRVNGREVVVKSGVYFVLATDGRPLTSDSTPRVEKGEPYELEVWTSSGWEEVWCSKI